MDEGLELIKYIYKDANMATITLEELIRDLEGKDNKIKPVVYDILEGYERYLEEAKEQLLANQKELEEENRRLKNQNHDLNFDLMLTRTIAQMEKSFLSHQIIMKTYNPEIRLPGNDSIFYSDLNEVQLSYLKSLKNADKEKKNAK